MIKQEYKKKTFHFFILSSPYIQTLRKIPNYTTRGSTEWNRHTRIVICQLIGTYRFLCNDAFM